MTSEEYIHEILIKRRKNSQNIDEKTKSEKISNLFSRWKGFQGRVSVRSKIRLDLRQAPITKHERARIGRKFI